VRGIGAADVYIYIKATVTKQIR